MVSLFVRTNTRACGRAAALAAAWGLRQPARDPCPADVTDLGFEKHYGTGLFVSGPGTTVGRRGLASGWATTGGSHYDNKPPPPRCHGSRATA